MELVLEVDWNVYGNAFASRGRCACMSGEILVVLAVLVFELRAQANCKHISSAKEFATANEIQYPAEIVRIKFRSPAENRAKRTRGSQDRDGTRTRRHQTESHQFECLACPPGERTTNPYSNPALSRADSPARAHFPFLTWSDHQADSEQYDRASGRIDSPPVR